MQLPNDVKPQDAPAALWALQQELLALAEHLLGPRDGSKQIYQPAFHSDGPPFLRNTPDKDGAFVELSQNAAGYWPTTVFEMAHETVHLLNPVAGGTNFLEEGIAVAFSRIAPQIYGLPLNEIEIGAYADALALVQSLPPDVFTAARMVRETVGALSATTLDDLANMFPSVERSVLCRLSQPFPLR